MRAKLFLVACVALTAGRLAAEIPADDGVLGRRALGAELRQLLVEEKFFELDRRAAIYTEKKETLGDGWWKLTEFFIGLGEPRAKASEAEWKAHLGLMERWAAASPGADAALIAQGVAYTRYGWAARGTGYADTVTDGGWKLFSDRLAHARAILELVRDRGGPKHPPSPAWYSAMLTIALGQSWERADYEKLFREATTAHPDYFEFYLKKANLLLPRWGGAEGEWQQFAREAGKKLGLDVFARICWANGQLEGFSNIFTTGGITWAEIDAGFAELMRKNPKSVWTLSFYARLAVAAKQHAAAERLFKQLGDDYYAEAWGTRAYYESSRAWALGIRRGTP